MTLYIEILLKQKMKHKTQNKKTSGETLDFNAHFLRERQVAGGRKAKSRIDGEFHSER